MPTLPAVGERLFVRLSRVHIGYVRVRETEGYRFYYDVEDPKLVPGARGAWAAGILLLAGEGQSWCRDTPEEIAAMMVTEALR